ncbi:MAG: sigma-54-dependent Fis family transcriptional regulator [Verrucomicrobia bacterium]|nr:sigma-54-dependent Fis family transcriptional regulator [Verrucomicrobiota bacterium]
MLLKRTKILALSFVGARDLALSLQAVLEAARAFDFELQVEILPDGQWVARDNMLLRTIAKARPQVLVICLGQGEHPHAKAMFELARRILPAVPIVVLTQAQEPEEWRELLALAPDDFITPPLRPVDVFPRLWRLRPDSSESDPVVHQLKEKLGLKQLIGDSPALLTQIQRIPPVARCDATVLITGETGTGKEMFARAIHFLSPRSAKSFNPLNCGAIPVDLVENELFGHQTGAFTGANTSSAGLLRQTDGGTLFLDEVDCLPLFSQVKLLRFLQEKEFRPLGATKPSRADVRVIAASNANLEDAVRNGSFRRDLYYRLNVIGLVLPPLRERKEDIPALARHFVAKHAAAFKAPARELTAVAVQKLMLYDWPGNVRELENVIARSVVLNSRTVLGPVDIELPTAVAVEPDESFQTLKTKLIARFERGYIQDLLRVHNGNITRAAQAAGKHRRAFWEMMRKYQIAVQPQAHR